MKSAVRLIALIALASSATCTLARDDIKEFSIADALATEQAKNILGDDIKFYFGDQPHGTIVKKFMETRTNKKTNGANKSDKEACEWAFLSTMKALRDKARSVGANAVVNIRSNYRDNLTSSATTFKCGSGMLMSGVALAGDVVELK